MYHAVYEHVPLITSQMYHAVYEYVPLITLDNKS